MLKRNRELCRAPSRKTFGTVLSTHWRSSESAIHWIRDALYREAFCRMRNPVAILNRSLLINACAFITNTLRIRKKTSAPALRERFSRRRSARVTPPHEPVLCPSRPLKEKAVPARAVTFFQIVNNQNPS
ncbi:MAG TPA: hypothetical protein P5026_00265 [Kiritimatiellia bacterium]|nr:hypothetical protein [Kiritimatiellia bacterium]HRU69529.1 hypothetical protein [Kiritimatiellia bacterium]